jgi:LmbE family N-acetylglucosaminyl deacetylase
MRSLAVFLLLASAMSFAQTSRTILAVFAHPDDESVAGPVLARYARDGNKVYLVIATKGEKGANERAAIPAGDALAKVRREEATCACKQLGIEPPIMIGINDGEMGAIASPLGHNIQEVADRVAQLITELHPAAVITWGADGGYGHPDHRLVGDAVTQVIESSKSDVKLYYVGFSPTQTELVNKIWPIIWHATDPAYLPVHVSFSKADLTAAQRAIECHKSQFAPEQVNKLEDALDKGWNQQVLFRPWFSDKASDDLLK